MTGISDNIKRTKVKEELARRIVSGEFAYGSRFPGLHELGRACGISYVTICKAVKMLADEGYLRNQPGIGYFVCYAEPGSKAAKEVNVISSPGYYRQYRSDFEFGIGQFRKHGWKVDLLLGRDLYEFTGQLNSPHAYSIVTAFNVNWQRFAATFSHLVKRTVVLGRLSGNPEITSIICDEYETVRQAMEHFANMGRKRVALVTALPQSELESLRIAAWRNLVLASGLPMDWMRRHLISLDLENQPEDPVRIAGLFRRRLSDCLKDTDAVILPSASSLFFKVCRELKIRIPEELAVLAIGAGAQPEPGIPYLDNNYRGHFEYALEILEDRFQTDHIIPGSWYFCPPRGIIAANINHKTTKTERKKS